MPTTSQTSHVHSIASRLECLTAQRSIIMLFHEALHLVFTTFSRQVLQQGRLTNYLADCGVFDTFDDRRTICLTIDNLYGARIYTCLSHSPYKEQFDAIVTEVKQLHPSIDPSQVDYVFQSIRFAWGKIKSVRPPKIPNLFALQKRKKRSCHTHLPPTSKKRSRRPSIPHSITFKPKTRARIKVQPTSIHYSPIYYQKRTGRVVLYILALIFLFCSCVMYNTNHGTLATVILLVAVGCFYVIYKYLK